MKLVLGLFSMLTVAASAQAKTVNIVCTPNSYATFSQFAGQATLQVDQNNSVEGTQNFSTKVSKSQEASSVEAVKVNGEMVVIPAGQIAKNEIISFSLKAESREILIHLNSGMPTPRGSTMLIDGKDRFASVCEIK